MSNYQKKQLSSKLSEKFCDFITQHSPSQFSRHLRSLLLDYMIQKQKTGFPVDFNIHLWELSDLFVLLDCATDEWENSPEDGRSAA